MRTASRSAALLAAVVLATPALAVEPWSGDVGVGYLATSGNSESSSVNGKFELVYTAKRWRNTLNGAATQSAQEDEATGETRRSAERYTAGDKADFNFTERDYAFVAFEWEKDLVGPIRERMSETAGYGRKVLTGPEHTLELELGAGVRQTETQVTPEAPVAVTSDDAIGRGRLAYRWAFTENNHFAETIKVESGESNTLSESVSELKLQVVGALFALASFTVRQNSDVPPGTEKTDTIASFSLGWTFGK